MTNLRAGLANLSHQRVRLSVGHDMPTCIYVLSCFFLFSCGGTFWEGFLRDPT